MDLSLVSIEDLIDEIAKRKEAFAIAFLERSAGKDFVRTKWAGRYIVKCGLAAVLLSDIVNEVDIQGEKSDGQ